MKLTSKLIIALVLMCGCLWQAHAVKAMTVGPALFDLVLNPGESVTQKISITNDEAAAKTYYFSIQKFIPSGAGGQQEFLPPNDVTGLPSWIYLDRPMVTLQPGESRDVSFTVRVPDDARAGGHYAAIFLSTEPPVPNDTGKIVTGSRTGMLVLLKVQGLLIEKLALKDFAAEPSDKLDRLPAGFRVVLQNLGDTHVVPQGQITIKNFLGSVVAKVPVNHEGGRLLPGSERRFLAVWQKQAPGPADNFWEKAKQEWHNFAIGPYTATLEMSGSAAAGMGPQTARLSIWPWRLLVLGGGGLALLFILSRWYRRRIIRQLTKKSNV